MFRLDITVGAVEQWCRELFETKEDLSDVESAADLLSELTALSVSPCQIQKSVHMMSYLCCVRRSFSSIFLCTHFPLAKSRSFQNVLWHIATQAVHEVKLSVTGHPRGRTLRKTH